MSDGGQRCCHIPSDTGAWRSVWRMSEVTGLTFADQGRAWEQEKDTADLRCTWEQRHGQGMGRPRPVHCTGYNHDAYACASAVPVRRGDRC